jgi:hypothetical protein
MKLRLYQFSTKKFSYKLQREARNQIKLSINNNKDIHEVYLANDMSFMEIIWAMRFIKKQLNGRNL